MVFSEPIYYKEGFRYIPNHPRYAINIIGELIDTNTNVRITREYLDNAGYITFYIQTPDKNGNRHIKAHRLIALAWLPNDDYVNRPLINHIDGNKRNNTLSNLEWVSPAENNIHAQEIGLNYTSKKMKVYDTKTGAVKIYNSLMEMANDIGMQRGISSTNFTHKLPGYLWKKRYEIKELDDTSPVVL